MLLDSSPKLEDLIIEILAQKAYLSAKDIDCQLKLGTKEYSVQGIYKILRQLEEGGIVVKYKQKYSLRLSWLAEVQNLAKCAFNKVQRQRSIYLPDEGKRLIWHFNNLLTLNNFWAQILLLLINQASKRQLFTWMPHPWFHLVYSEQEKQYIKSLDLTNTHLYLINGGTTFLDKWAEKYWIGGNIDYSFAESYFHLNYQDKYINIFGNYILIVKLDNNISSEIERFYQKIKSFDDFDFSEVFRIFGSRIRASLWLENNPKKASYFRKKFINYFGIKE